MNGITLAGRSAYLADAEVLVVADLHVGRDESSAVSLPLGEADDLRRRLGRLCSRFDPETVVVAGDVVHTFDGLSERTRETLDRLREACRAAGADLELVAGNHDAALGAGWDGPVRDAYVVEAGSTGDSCVDRTVVCHGHEPPDAAGDRYVFGHVHPTIEIEGDRRPCFLRGEGVFRGADVLCLPAFTRLAPGVTVNGAVGDDLSSPLLDDAGRLAPVVYDSDADETLRFPPLGEFRRLL